MGSVIPGMLRQCRQCSTMPAAGQQAVAVVSAAGQVNDCPAHIPLLIKQGEHAMQAVTLN